MSEGTFERVYDNLFSSLDVLELEAARLVVLAETDPDDRVLAASASVIYKTVAAFREELRRLRRLNAAAGE